MSNEVFKSGAQRDTQTGKLRYDLISPLANYREAQIFGKGAVKYGDRNWEKGMPLSRCLASALRHLHQWLMGETDEDHLGQFAWNARAMVHFDEGMKRGLYPLELDDRPKYKVKRPTEYAEPQPMTAEEVAAKHGVPIYNPTTGLTPLQEAACSEHACCGEPLINYCRPLRVYISGPMRSKPDNNFPAFDRARTDLLIEGHQVISPADLDRKSRFLPSQKDYAARDTAAINGCDALFMLRDWEYSEGAVAEFFYARWIGLKVFYEDSLVTGYDHGIWKYKNAMQEVE